MVLTEKVSPLLEGRLEEDMAKIELTPEDKARSVASSIVKGNGLGTSNREPQE